MDTQTFLDKIIGFDEQIFLNINIGLKNSILDFIFPKVSFLAEPLVLLSVGILLFLLERKSARLSAALFILSIIFTRMIVFCLKDLVSRPRPMDVFKTIKLIGSSVSYAFPSGHTTTIAVAATILSFKYKKLSWLFILIALAVGISRVYVGHHYPSDVLAGWFLGFVIGLLFVGAQDLFRKIFSSSEDSQN
ncbi:phosphatase PAP2 family protein [Candidatus Omnitrophota bacterium]